MSENRLSADDFDREVEQLRNSHAFQAFLEQRSSKARPRRPLADVARDIEAEIAAQDTPADPAA